MNFKKIAASILALLIVAGCTATPAPTSSPATAPAPSTTPTAATQPVTAPAAAQKPKYIFLFIGDGMSYPQLQLASNYLGAVAEPSPAILKGGKPLSFMSFPVAGSATTFDSTSFAPDSASTSTSLSTGFKTHSGVINMDETKQKSYEAITETLKEKLGFKIGVISSVNLNHATPAAFYAHQPSRKNYYEIGEELVASGFEYFAGGGLISPTGEKSDRPDLYELAAKGGYKIAKTQIEAEALTSADQKALIIGETLADSDSLSYENDRAATEWSLRDYVRKGIEVLDNDTGFFMMVEGGKIDWACHANDAGSTIADTLALSDAVEEAVAFAAKNPDETLILVTGDHETGGLTIGYAGTDYDLFLENVENQKISYAKYDSDYVAGYIAQKTPFEAVLADVKTLFGLISPTDPTATEGDKLVLTAYELSLLKDAYDRTMAGGVKDPTQREYILYGDYEPLSVTITHLLNNKSGINFASYAHTGLPVPVFAEGPGEELFEGFYDNTAVYHKLAGLLGIS